LPDVRLALVRVRFKLRPIAMLKVGFIGWRGMVGSVLMERMRAEKDFDSIDASFFTTSNVGGKAPDVGQGQKTLLNAKDVDALSKNDVLVSCQGGDYTTDVYPRLRSHGFTGYFIDAASTLRMNDDAVLILDPVNLPVIENGLKKGIKTYVGANCTVSLMLMAIGGLFRASLVEWLSSMTYQAASGAGAANMRELALQMQHLGLVSKNLLDDPTSSALAIERAIGEALRSSNFPIKEFGAPLAASLIPWIDRPVDMGQTKEEWKGFAETNKILETPNPIPVDGICVRVGSMRCHAQGLTIKLKRNVSLDEIETLIKGSNEWVKWVPNDKAATLKELSPAAISGTLTVPIGRVRKMRLGEDFLTAFTVGDQLLWGAAEPLRRMLSILRRHLNA
jgi:aspartate-semialdehyde dehydrogenase